MTDKPLLHMAHISKAFPGVQALDDVELTVYPGEILALVGENGAGKSTLMRILNGVYSPDRGEIVWQGRRVEIHSPRDAQALGISMIHQELALIPYLNVGKNIYLGREPEGPLPGTVDWGRLYAQASQQLERLGMKIDPRAPVRHLPLAQQQMVEVAKALSLDARLLVMDEPTSSLTDREVDILFEQMRVLRAQGISIIFISHRLEEVFEIADRVTVLRDGRLVDSRPIAELTTEQIIRMMVGREVTEDADRPSHRQPEVVLEVEDLSAPEAIQGISFRLHRGEILGVAGLVGAGRTELAETIFGLRPASSGVLRLAQGNPGQAAQGTQRPRLAWPDVLALACALVALLAFFLLPWFRFEGAALTGWDLLRSGGSPYTAPAILLLVPAAAVGGLALTLWGVLDRRAGRIPASLAAFAGLVGLLYHALYLVQSSRQPTGQDGLDLLGAGFWVTLLAAVGLVAQRFLPRRAAGHAAQAAVAVPRGFRHPSEAIRHGIGFVPEDRKAAGLFLHMTVATNIIMTLLGRLARWGLIPWRRVDRIAGEFVRRLDIRTPSLQQQVQNLSGGNQQKVVIARWLTLEPRVLILDEPTRGIDVGAKAEIHRLMQQLAGRGVGILMISSELPEIMTVSDRVLVMREGRLAGEFDPRTATQDEVMSAAMGTAGNTGHNGKAT